MKRQRCHRFKTSNTGSTKLTSKWLWIALFILSCLIFGERHASAQYAYGFNGGLNGTKAGLYEVDMTTGAATFRADVLGSFTGANALAYSASLGSEGMVIYANGADSELAMWNRATGATVYSGDLGSFTGGAFSGPVRSGSFYGNSYYTIAEGTDDLWAVTFDSTSLAITSATKVADLTGDVHGYTFGDIAISPTGTLWATGTDVDTSGGKLFTVDLNSPTPTASTVANRTVYQGISFDPSGFLYANRDLIGPAHKWLVLDTGRNGAEFTLFSNEQYNLSDLSDGAATQASAPMAVPEPSGILAGMAGLMLLMIRAGRTLRHGRSVHSVK